MGRDVRDLLAIQEHAPPIGLDGAQVLAAGAKRCGQSAPILQ
jgi:hypothetical protein